MRRGPGIGAVAVLVIAVLLLVRGFGGEGGSDRRGGETPTARSATAPVVRVVDGDTIVVSLGGRDEDVRYIGVDTPETVKPDTPVQCFGPQASAENHRLVDGRTVRLVFDRERRDVYGRLLAYVYLVGGGRGQFVNAALVRGGYARTLTIPPNTAHEGTFRRLQARAGRDGRGLWAHC